MELNCAKTIIFEWLIVIGLELFGLFRSKNEKGTAGMTVPDCAQNVPVKVKKFQKFTNKTKNDEKKLFRINRLKIQPFLFLIFLVFESVGRSFESGPR